MNASLSEDSVAETAISKKNSDGKYLLMLFIVASRTFTKIENLFLDETVANI